MSSHAPVRQGSPGRLVFARASHPRLAMLLVCALALWGPTAGQMHTRPAQAEPTIWERATLDPEEAARQERYQLDLGQGLEYARAALAAGIASNASLPPSQRLQLGQEARRALQRAAISRPQAAEPHYYLALLAYYWQYSCGDGDNPCPFDPELARQIIDELDLFEQRAPQDPRLASMLSERAILRTRMSGVVSGAERRQYLEGAVADYRARMEHAAGLFTDWELLYGNAAEVLMMLGRLEESIDLYRRAQRVSASAGTVLGMAVALDRDERGAEALQLVRGLGAEALAVWELRVREGSVFYVPEDEVQYYLGLIAEARGDLVGAIAAYRRFEHSGANPQFAPRAAAKRQLLMRALGR